MRFFRSTVLLAAVSFPVAANAQPAPISANEFIERRSALAEKLEDGVLLALGGSEPRLDYISFFQIPVFRYLTGIQEPGAALLMIVKDGRDAGSTLFVQRRDPAREVWSGLRMGAEGAQARFATPARAHDELDAVLDSLAASGMSVLNVAGDVGVAGSRQTDHDQYLASLKTRHPGLELSTANGKIAELRAYKSAAELGLIRKAVDLTVSAHKELAAVIGPDRYEYEAQAMAEYVFRSGGAERPSFATIVGSGPNSTVLHYNANDRQMKSGEVVVVDIGASYAGYSADMTRTYPVNGKFSDAQKEIYQLVLDAQSAATREAVIGAQARRMNESASATLWAGLSKLGLVDSVGAVYDCSDDGSRKCSQLSLYYMHGLGHGIGLEVHDPDRYYYEQELGEGSIFTIEPGVYVREHLLSLIPQTPANIEFAARVKARVQRYANIGVRIEDDYLVTSQGLVWLTKSPREIPEIEAAMSARGNGANR